MILKADTILAFDANIERTNMLITSMEKIKGYDRMYQDRAYEQHYKLGQAVTESQNKELLKIEAACAEHAIISMATVYETFLKDLLQEVLYEYGEYFCSIETDYTEIIKKLVKGAKKHDYQSIGKELGINSRYGYTQLFKAYSIPIETPEEKALYDFIFVYRNSFIHHGNKMSANTLKKLEAQQVVKEEALTTRSKRLRTKVERAIPKTWIKVLKLLEKKTKKK